MLPRSSSVLTHDTHRISERSVKESLEDRLARQSVCVQFVTFVITASSLLTRPPIAVCFLLQRATIIAHDLAAMHANDEGAAPQDWRLPSFCAR